MDKVNPLLDMNLNLILPLKVLISTKSVTKSAELLNITQPTMSRHLHQLRDIFNDQLLVRVGSEYQLTPKATELSGLLDSTIEQLNQLFVSHFDPYVDKREFKIAAPDFVNIYIMNDILASIYHRNNKFKINNMNWDDQTKQLLLDGKLDIAISMDEDFSPAFYRRKVSDDYWVALVKKDHPLTRVDKITLDIFLSYPFVAVKTGGGADKPVEKALRSLGRERDIHFKTVNYLPMWACIERTECIGVVPYHQAKVAITQRELAIIDIPFEIPKLSYSIYWHERFKDDVAHRWLRNEIIDKLLQHPNHLP